MTEIWKNIEGYEGKYQVSNLGRVKSMIGQEKVLHPKKHRNGHLQIGLHKDKKRKTMYIHRLVAQAFIPNPDNLPCVNHKDENPSNNNVDNLEWCTQKYNCNYGTRVDRIMETKKQQYKKIYKYSFNEYSIKIIVTKNNKL